MKKGIHPEYREVLFHDISVDEYYLVRSTIQTDKTKKWEDFIRENNEKEKLLLATLRFLVPS